MIPAVIVIAVFSLTAALEIRFRRYDARRIARIRARARLQVVPPPIAPLPVALRDHRHRYTPMRLVPIEKGSAS